MLTKPKELYQSEIFCVNVEIFYVHFVASHYHMSGKIAKGPVGSRSEKLGFKILSLSLTSSLVHNFSGS